MEENKVNGNTVEEGKTMAIISYITVIGTIIAFVMNSSKKNTFAQFHIRQMIGIFVVQVAIGIVGSFVPMVSFLGLVVFVLSILGLIGAIQGEEKKIPVLGDYFQDWFKGI